MKNGLALTGAVLIAALALAAVAAPLLAPRDPGALDLAGDLEGPSRAHPLGQDELGRDILSRLLYGARASLAVGVIAVGLSLIVGTLVGMLAGYAGGFVDAALMRLVDVLLAFPGILLAIAIAGVLGPSFVNVIIALSLLGWVGFARLVRGQVLSLRERDFVTAARAIGASPARILGRHILPELAPPVMVQATFSVAGFILAESSLSFLGLGPQDMPTWGGMLSEGVDYLLFAPHLSTWPGLAVLVTVLAFNFLGDGLRDALDVKV
ncbi:MAG: ABC transporter permease [Deltaproteobacteria bacterium]|nr:ABC transporter permease [Deltaproteobacteria bacterium]